MSQIPMRFLSATETSLRWGHPELGHRTVAARAALANHVGARVGADGAVRDRCRSRIFESALMLRLLRLERAHPELQDRIVRYLDSERRRRQLDPFDRFLVAAVLTGTAAPDAGEVERQLSIGERFASHRKQRMFRAVMALIGGGRFDDCREDDFAPEGTHQSWVRGEMIALKILHAVHLERPAWIKDDDIRALTEVLKQSPLREHMVLRQILAVFALRSIPGQESAVRTGIARVLAVQDQDGGFPYLSGLEIFCTAVAGLALTGADHGSARAAPARMADYLASQQQADGGWAYGEGIEQTDVDDTVYCLELLRAVGQPRHAGHVSRAVGYLLAMPSSDGGFPTFAHGAVSETAMTAAAVGALSCATPPDHVPLEILRKAVSYILDHQRDDGTFERSWSLCEANAICRVMMAVRRFRAHLASEATQPLEARIDHVVARSQQYLRGAQNEDGGWGQVAGASSDVLSTSYSLIALAQIGDAATLHGGLHYLVACQQPHGGFVSIPDQAGPRPIPFDIPVVADVFALVALDQALASHVEPG
jgi:squalene-hopene/tetraprenyl-beta-curcumene cyclase